MLAFRFRYYKIKFIATSNLYLLSFFVSELLLFPQNKPTYNMTYITHNHIWEDHDDEKENHDEKHHTQKNIICPRCLKQYSLINTCICLHKTSLSFSSVCFAHYYGIVWKTFAYNDLIADKDNIYVVTLFAYNLKK